MNEIEKKRTIDKRALDGVDYFGSLLSAASSRDMISDADADAIRSGVAALLAFRTETYTDGESSSVTVETAQALFTSVCWLVGLGLKQREPDDAIEYLKASGVNAAYRDGVARQKELLLKAKRVYQTLSPRLDDYGNVFLRSTVHKGFPAFFRKYVPDDHRLLANDSVLTADYPVYLQLKQTAGVEFIKNYAEQIYCENSFCAAFPRESVTALLRSFNASYQNTVFNIFEIVFTRALGCVICGSEPLSLAAPERYYDTLFDKLRNKSVEECTNALSDALAKLRTYIALLPAAVKYAEACLPQTAAATVRAVRLNARGYALF